MKHSLIILFLLVATPLLAVDDCGEYRELAALYQVRNALLKPYGSTYDAQKHIDRTLDDLRGPLGGGAYRWVRWVRPSGDGPVDKNVHIVSAAHDENTDTFEASSHHVYGVRIVVPRKRSLLNANAPVYVGDVVVTYNVKGRPKTMTSKIDAWLSPDTSRTIDLDGIFDEASVRVDASTAPKNAKQSVVEVHFRQAVPEDDPDNPAYETIRGLLKVRDDLTPDTIDYAIATLERHLDPDADSLPLLSIAEDLRRAEQLIRSNKEDDHDRGMRLLKDTMRKLH
ncbi:MAG TPA: hypothetical protein VMU84_18785 [Thermoanaerobaculia bacterium]|nr:hypothetical protein [Thermoanaerobaculia bacterium]